MSTEGFLDFTKAVQNFGSSTEEVSNAFQKQLLKIGNHCLPVVSTANCDGVYFVGEQSHEIIEPLVNKSEFKKGIKDYLSNDEQDEYYCAYCGNIFIKNSQGGCVSCGARAEGRILIESKSKRKSMEQIANETLDKFPPNIKVENRLADKRIEIIVGRVIKEERIKSND